MRPLTTRRLMRWVALSALFFAVVAWLAGSVRQAQQDARQSMCVGHLKQIAVALHMYHEVFGRFPPAYVAGPDGTPWHSWRVLILPYLEYGPLYNRYNFAEPWDGPNNRKLAGEMPSAFTCPNRPDDGAPWTCYLAITGPGTAFPGASTTSLADARHPDRTIVLGEVADARVHWMEPRDFDAATLWLAALGARPPSLSSHDPHGPAVAGLDGHVSRLDPRYPNFAPAAKLRSLTAIDDPAKSPDPY